MTEIFDERIQKDLGRAQRQTMWLLWILSLGYLTLYTAAVRITGTELRLPLILAPLLTVVGGGILLAFGELYYLGAAKDERKQAAQANYYVRAFYGFVLLIACAFCIHVAVNLARPIGAPDQAKGAFPALLLTVGGVFFLYRLKTYRIPLNFTVIESEKQLYRRRVWRNIGVLGLAIAAFTLVSILLFCCLQGDPVWILVLLLAALLQYLGLGAEYWLLSFVEYREEQAKAQGALSPLPQRFFWTVVLLEGVSLLSYWIISATSGSLTAVGAQLWAKVDNLLESWHFFFLALAVLSLWSGIEPQKDPVLRRGGSIYLWFLVLSLGISGVLSAFLSAFFAVEYMTEDLILFYRLCVGVSQWLTLFCQLFTLVCLSTVVHHLLQPGKKGKSCFAVLLLLGSGRLLCGFLFLHLTAIRFQMIENLCSFALCLFLGILLTAWCRKIKLPHRE